MSDKFQCIMNFTADEALFLYEQGFDDLLVAYPTWDKQLLQSVCQAIKEGATITLMIDSIEHIERLEKIAEEMDGKFFVCIEIDLRMEILGLNFGVYRLLLKTAEQDIELRKTFKHSKRLFINGLRGYELQIAGV